MQKEAVILIAESDTRQFEIIQRALKSSRLPNELIHFSEKRNFFLFLDQLLVEEDLKKHPYILLLDLDFSGGDGMEVLEKIKNNPAVKIIPVIIFSESDQPRILEQCHHLGCGLFLLKPDQPDSFSEMIRKVADFLSIIEIPYCLARCVF